MYVPQADCEQIGSTKGTINCVCAISWVSVVPGPICVVRKASATPPTPTIAESNSPEMDTSVYASDCVHDADNADVAIRLLIIGGDVTETTISAFVSAGNIRAVIKAHPR